MSDDRRKREDEKKRQGVARRAVDAALDGLGNAREKFKARRKAAREKNLPPPYWNKD